MRAWKKGAVIGGVIGLRRVLDFIFFPIIGAVIGAVLVQSIYIFVSTTKIKLWQKAGILGALWGVLSGAMGYLLLIGGTGGHTTISKTEGLVFIILFLPGYIGLLIGDRMNDFRLLFILPLLIGALIGSIIGFALEKYKHQRVTL